MYKAWIISSRSTRPGFALIGLYAILRRTLVLPGAATMQATPAACNARAKP